MRRNLCHSGHWSCDTSCGFDVSGCTTICGDNQVRGFEDCDGGALNGQTCRTLGFDFGDLKCGPDCLFDDSNCGIATCGNNRIDPRESCDGSNLAGQRCETLGFKKGELSCRSNCLFFDVSGCCCEEARPGCAACPVCGNGIAETPFEFCDGPDLNGQTCNTQGYPVGTLSCNSTCDGFNHSGCQGH